MIIKPGLFSVVAAQDRLRCRFDQYNEQLIKSGLVPDFLFIGDSITEYWDLNLYFEGNGLIINRGVGGDIGQDVLRRWDADVIQLKPKQVIYLIGCNDITYGEQCVFRGDAMRSVEENNKWILDNIRGAIEKTLSAGIKIAQGSILPSDICPPYDKDYRNKVTLVLNEQIKELCAEYKIPFLDYYPHFVVGDYAPNPEYFDEDGIHVSPAGYDVMKKILVEANIGLR